MKIDAHQHFWQPQRGDYDWMPQDNVVLNRAYAPHDLAPSLSGLGIDGTVLVQAAASIEETEYMLGLADATPWIKAVVGWVNFEDATQTRHLTRLAAHPKFVGVRPMIQDIPDVDWMLRDDVQWAFEAIIDLDLTFDALGFPQHIANFLILAKRYPTLRTVYDHCLKPQIRDHEADETVFSEWARGISRLADETGGYCKLSGLLTEANETWAPADIAPFAHHVLRAFGADRVMWGSDWPVCKLRTDYEDWHHVAQGLTDHLPDAARADLFGGTAARFYRLS